MHVDRLRVDDIAQNLLAVAIQPLIRAIRCCVAILVFVTILPAQVVHQQAGGGRRCLRGVPTGILTQLGIVEIGQLRGGQSSRTLFEKRTVRAVGGINQTAVAIPGGGDLGLEQGVGLPCGRI